MSKIFLPCLKVAETQVCGSDSFTWNWIHAHSSQSLVYTGLKSRVCEGKPGGASSHCPSRATCVIHFLQKERSLGAHCLPRDRTSNSSVIRCFNGKPAPFPVSKRNVWYLPVAGFVDISVAHQLKFQSKVELYSRCT